MTTVTINDIKYSIVGVTKSPTRISLKVKYFTDLDLDGLLFTLDLPIENGDIPRGTALHDYIMFHAPVGQLDVKANPPDDITFAIDISEILAVLPPEIGIAQRQSYQDMVATMVARCTVAAISAINAGADPLVAAKSAVAVGNPDNDSTV